jgi:hypothetical protein
MVGVDTHRQQHGRRFECLRRARRSGVHRDAVLVEREQDRLGLDAVDPDAQQVRECVVGIGGAESGDARDVLGHFRGTRDERTLRRALGGEVDGGAHRAEADPRRNVLDAGAPRPFLRAPDDQRIESQPAPYEQSARAFRSAHLVRGDRAQVGVERAEVDRDVTDRRARVDMHDARPIPSRGDHLGYRLPGPDFVVRELYRDELRVRTYRVDHLGRVEAS